MITAENFVPRFAGLFENSLWVVERAVKQAPFRDAAALHVALMNVVANASPAEQMSLIMAHPELGARAVPLTEASDSEQTGAGLQALTADELETFEGLNRAYRQKHGFPFIICVRMHSKAHILALLARRLGNNTAIERAQALFEIGHIARLRMEDLLV